MSRPDSTVANSMLAGNWVLFWAVISLFGCTSTTSTTTAQSAEISPGEGSGLSELVGEATTWTGFYRGGGDCFLAAHGWSHGRQARLQVLPRQFGGQASLYFSGSIQCNDQRNHGFDLTIDFGGDGVLRGEAPSKFGRTAIYHSLISF